MAQADARTISVRNPRTGKIDFELPVTSRRDLAAKVERSCQQVGLEPERRAYHPHITLARWKGRRTRELHDYLTRQAALSSEPFAITGFTLFESRLSRHGAHYQEVANYELQ